LYRTQFELSEKFPEKPEETADLNDEIAYSKKLLEAIQAEVARTGSRKAKAAASRVADLLENEKTRKIQSAADEDAKLGYKSEHNSFFGYKTHMAMTEERIITGLEITTGEAADGEYLQGLARQSERSGVAVEETAGDTAYSHKKNLEHAKEKKIRLISKLNPIVSHGTGRKTEGFIHSKDAGMYQCPAGHLATRKSKTRRPETQKANAITRYYFDTKICASCPIREGCYKEGAKSRAYYVTILSKTHKEQEEFQESDCFKERAKQRYMIEAKNAELKHAHGLEKADSTGLKAMRLQSYFTAFVVNAKRIVKLLEKKAA
jgi:hypothetical protein